MGKKRCSGPENQNRVMEIRVEKGSEEEQHRLPLLEEKGIYCDDHDDNDDDDDDDDDKRKTLIQKAINQTFESSAHLANLLPTGTVLAFQLLAPIFSNQGHCDAVSRAMTNCLIVLCSLSCFFTSFTDSFRDTDGTVRYGLATPHGLWIIDCGEVAGLPPDEMSKYRLRVMDFVHAVLSVLVFAAMALFDQNVLECFFPSPSEETTEVLMALPVGIGVVCSMLFVAFPTTRHGIGFPLSTR